VGVDDSSGDERRLAALLVGAMKGRRILRNVIVEVPFTDIAPGKYHDAPCAWDGEDSCEACSEELDEAYDAASGQVETDWWVTLDWMLTNKPKDFAGDKDGHADSFWAVEVSLGRRRKVDGLPFRYNS
jgi:hypothetical protein